MVCLLVLMGVSKVSAQTLVLHHADKTTTDVDLYLQPRVAFQGDKLLITSTILNLEFPKDNVLRFTYGGRSTGISNPKGKVSYSEDNGKIVFHGIRSKDKIAVYTLKGIRVPVNITFSGSDATLPVSAIPSGVYLLNVNGRTSKFTKR